MQLIQRGLTGLTYLNTVTDLLQRIRLEGAFAGLYEAADLQWWWREDDQDAHDPARQLFWFDAQGHAVACLVRFDAGDEWLNDFVYLPSSTKLIQTQVLPTVIAAISQPDKPATFTVRDSDTFLLDAVRQAGYLQADHAYVQAELVTPSARTPLPPGFHLTTRIEDHAPHHLMVRNGNEIARKLGECSLYRPDLDLCIRDTTGGDHGGTVAAYALFWMDEVTKVGLLEPLRTEKAYYRMGLAQYLIGEGIARLTALGATSIRVTYSNDNPAAASLYHRTGFVDRYHKLIFKREPIHNNSQNEVPTQ